MHTLPYALHEKVVSFLKGPKELFIDGEFQKSLDGKPLKLIIRQQEKYLQRYMKLAKGMLTLRVQAARKAFEEGEWPSLSAADRSALMHKLADLMERDFEVLAQLDTLDNGKPIHEIRYGDLPNAIGQLRYFAGWTNKMTGQTVPVSNSYFNYTLHEPVGVVGQIIPWNFPIQMALWKIAPALATGCTIVLKPAEQTPLSALYLAKLIQEAEFQKGSLTL